MSSGDKGREVLREFRMRRSRQLTAIAVVIGMLVSILWKLNHPGILTGELSRPVAVFLELALMAAFLFYSAYNWRCPSCGRYLGADINPGRCRSCGARFR